MPLMTSATVRIPGTTANLGSGFDTLGLAVALYNRATVRRRDDRRVEITSPIAEDARAGALAMLEEAATAFFKRFAPNASGWIFTWPATCRSRGDSDPA